MAFLASVGPTTPASGAAPSPAGGLAVDRSRCEAELASWVHCVSASTPEGKAKIRDLTLRLHGIDAKIEKAVQAEPAKAEAPAAPERFSNPTETLGNLADLYA